MVLYSAKRETGTWTASQALLPHGSHCHGAGQASAGLLLLAVGIQDTSALHVPYHPDGSHASVAGELHSWACDMVHCML